MKKELSKVLIIYTGGTIGMKEDPSDQTLKPFDFSAILTEVPELGKFACQVDSVTFDPLIDSSDVEPLLWKQLAEMIVREYDRYDGFVILHGTDTMAYSASALSLMLENLSKPVVFTGSQLPIGRPRTDGKENLISSVEIASARNRDGSAKVPEVCIFFNSQLLRGNRATKFSSVDFDAFRSPNWPVLATAGIDIRYNNDSIRTPGNGKISAKTCLDTRVSIMKVHPGITASVARGCLLGEDIRACIIETYGSGNAISKPWFTDIVRQACEQGRIVLNITQCLMGEVNMDIYATGRALKDTGVISGADMTTESALAKLFVLMGENDDNNMVKEKLKQDLRGEMSC